MTSAEAFKLFRQEITDIESAYSREITDAQYRRESRVEAARRAYTQNLAKEDGDCPGCKAMRDQGLSEILIHTEHDVVKRAGRNHAVA